MRVAVLGPLEVLANDSAPVALPGGQEGLLLCVLAAGAPGVVAADRLTEVLGNGDSLQVALRRLRSALEPGLPDRSSGQYVLRRGAGLTLGVARADIDALRFTDLVGRGRARLAAGDPADAVRLLTTALGLWRGDPYADWPDAAFADAERSRLAGIRADAEAALLDARQQLARQADVPSRRERRVVREVPASERWDGGLDWDDPPSAVLSPAVGPEPTAAAREDGDRDGRDDEADDGGVRSAPDERPARCRSARRGSCCCAGRRAARGPAVGQLGTGGPAGRRGRGREPAGRAVDIADPARPLAAAGGPGAPPRGHTGDAGRADGRTGRAGARRAGRLGRRGAAARAPGGRPHRGLRRREHRGGVAGRAVDPAERAPGRPRGVGRDDGRRPVRHRGPAPARGGVPERCTVAPDDLHAGRDVPPVPRGRPGRRAAGGRRGHRGRSRAAPAGRRAGRRRARRRPLAPDRGGRGRRDPAGHRDRGRRTGAVRVAARRLRR